LEITNGKLKPIPPTGEHTTLPPPLRKHDYRVKIITKATEANAKSRKKYVCFYLNPCSFVGWLL